MKKILLILILMIPVFVNADCNYEEFVLAGKLASEVNYETEYNEKNGTFNIIFYNVVDLLFLEYDSKLYYGDDNNEVKMIGLKQGSIPRIMIRANVLDCGNDLQSRYVKIPYYNSYFGSDICEGYEMLTPCGSEFLSYKNNYSIVKTSIDNYNDSFAQEDEETTEQKKVTIFEQIVDFGKNWGIKILVVIVSTLISIAIYNAYYRKVKHGV